MGRCRMLKFFPFAWILLMVVVGRAQGAESTILSEEFQSATLGRTYRYNVYLPSGYTDSERRYATVYLLHGRGDDMDDWLNIRPTLDQLIAEGSIPPLIAILPDMPSSERAGYYVDSQYTGADYPAEAVETAFFSELIPHVDTAYRTVARREGRLVGGYSMGGYGAIRYGLAHPDAFAGALALSPAVYTPQPPADSSTREFGAFGQDTRLFDEAIYASLNYLALIGSFAASRLSLAMFIAVGDDEYHNPEPDDWLHDLDVEAHLLYSRVVRVPTISAEFRVYDGGHDWDVWERGFSEGMQFLTRFIDAGG